MLAQANDAHSDIVNAWFPNQSIARKTAISYHHALLASRYEEGYLILELSPDEQDRLTQFGYRFSIATEFQERLQAHQERLSAPQSNKTSQTTISGFPCYDTVEGTFTRASELAQQNPQLAEWIDIGDSYLKTTGNGGYDLQVLKITNQATSGDKPVLFIHSAMHAREYATAPLALSFASELLETYETNADTRWILDEHEIHFLLHMNPDGRKRAETGLSWRKNANPSFCPSNSNLIGVDLNRNFSDSWSTAINGSSPNECDQTYRGPSPASEPETQAVEAYVRSLFADRRGNNDSDAAPSDTAGMHIDIHAFSELILWPWGHTAGTAPNGTQLQTLGRKLAFFNGYVPTQSIGLYPTDGTSDDVSYGELGVAAITFELGTEFFQNCSVFESDIKPDNLPALRYAAKAVRAPYQLPAGPDIVNIEIDGAALDEVYVGDNFSLSARANDVRYNNGAGVEPSQNIDAIEYSINRPFSDASATVSALVATDGVFDSNDEPAEASVDVSSLSLGRHMIYLRARDADGNVGVTSAKFFNRAAPPSNQSPTASFSETCTDLQCSFDATASSDTDGTIASYSWDYGDGNSGSGSNTNHTYASAGSFSVTLTITDNAGATATQSKTLSVQAPAPPAPPPPTTSSPSGGGGHGGALLLGLSAWLALRRKRQTADPNE
ncbi:MAG: M14 family zinc carboxypeptidase [Pseudomonadota bacterium]